MLENKTISNVNKRLILIDGNAIIHRAYHALPPFTTKKGELVNAVYGFTSTLLSVIAEFKPDYIVASFDLADKTFRHEQFEQYKATRVKADDQLYAQIPRIKEIVKAFNIPLYEKSGFEADDVIGTIANQIKETNEKLTEKIQTIIVTGDMDTLQLINDSTSVYAMRRGLSDSILYDKEKVFERYGLMPEQIIDYKSLRGDPSDNIPGVKGIGEKTAVTLLQKYTTLDAIYANLNEIKDSIKNKLEKEKVQAYLSKNLATIRLDVPLKFDLQKAVLHDFDRQEIIELFSDLNFFSLIKRLPDSANIDAEKTIPKEVCEIKDFKYSTVNKKNGTKLLAEISLATEISVATEINLEKLTGVAVSWKTGRVAFFHASGEHFNELKTILKNPDIKKIGFDLKKIYKQLFLEDIVLQNLSFDIMLAAYVLNPGEKISLEKITFSELGEEVVFEKKSPGQLTLVSNPEEEEKSFNLTCQKADYTLKIKNILMKKISQISIQQKEAAITIGTLESIFTEMEMPLIKILAKMELTGIKLNSIIFLGISEKLTTRLKNLGELIHQLAGKSFNINSPSQLSNILFYELKLPTNLIKKTKTSYSTASPELEKLKGEHKIIEKIEEYRELFKLKTTYLDTLPQLVDKNSRIHTTLNQAITATGRLSSTDPNLQNIPIKTDLGKLLRTAFEAKKNHVLISADYSQIELRAIAHVSRDEKLIKAFQGGEDIHKITAAEINKVTLSQVTKTMRQNAKALNFGIIYGIGAFGFSQSAGISRKEAQDFINTYMENFSGVAAYMKKTRETAKKYGFVETILGRRRYLPEINSPNFQIAASAERMAINMPIQGLASDIVKLAMIALQPLVDSYSEKVQAILQIHDEIIFEAHEDVAAEFTREAKKIMENVLKLAVPLVVDFEIGNNWGEL